MARPRAITDRVARAAFRRLAVAGSPVTGRTFAAEAGISQRSAFRYFQRMKAGIRDCDKCHGTGFIRRKAVK